MFFRWFSARNIIEISQPRLFSQFMQRLFQRNFLAAAAAAAADAAFVGCLPTLYWRRIFVSKTRSNPPRSTGGRSTIHKYRGGGGTHPVRVTEAVLGNQIRYFIRSSVSDLIWSNQIRSDEVLNPVIWWLSDEIHFHCVSVYVYFDTSHEQTLVKCA